MNSLFVIGLNHKFAPVKFREKLAFSKNDLPSVLLHLRNIPVVPESLVLSTCNRVEIYGVAADLKAAREELVRFLCFYHAVEEEALCHSIYFYEEEEAVRHLFRVASGLDSMVVGEHEILGQVKEAYRLASQAGNVKSLLHQFFERALRTAKRTREETEIARGAVSVSSVAVELAEKIFGRISQERILILGTGKVGELTLKRLMKTGTRTVWVASRTMARAEEMARKYAVLPIPFETWKQYLKDADIVISSTAAPHPIIHYEDVKQVMALRKHKPLFIIDLAVPRDAEEKVNTLDDVYLYNIDDLHTVCQSNIKFREKEVAKCEVLIEKQIEEFLRWLKHLEAAPTIRKLQAHLDTIIEEELRLAAGTRTPKELEELRRVLSRVKGKLLHDPLMKLKEAQDHGGGHHYHEALHTLFDLQKVKLTDEENKIPDREPGKQPGSCSSRESAG